MLALLVATTTAHAGWSALTVDNALPTPVLLSVDGSRGFLVPDEDVATFDVPAGAREVTLVEAGSGCVVGEWSLELPARETTTVSVDAGCAQSAGTAGAAGVWWDVRAELHQLGRSLFGEKTVVVRPGPRKVADPLVVL